MLLGALVLSLGLSAWRWTHAPDLDSIAAVAQRVEGSWQAKDVVVVAPGSVVQVRQRLGHRPLIDWLPRRDTGPLDLFGFSRVHLIQLNTPAEWLVGDPLAGHEVNLVQHMDAGYAQWRLYQLARPTRLHFDLTEEVADLAVTAIYPDTAPLPCTDRRKGRTVCPRDPGWNYVAAEVHTIGGEARSCVWLHPVAGGGALRLELPAHLFWRPSTMIVAGMGFTAHAARTAQAPVRVRLVAEHRPWDLWTVDHPVIPAWRTFRFRLGDALDWAPTAAPATAAPLGRLWLQIESENNGAAHFCMALRLVEEE